MSSDFETFGVWPQLLGRHQIEVQCGPSFNRIPCAALDDAYIRALWSNLCAKNENKTFFNGTKFRLHHAAEARKPIENENTTSQEESRVLRFQFGITDYRCSTGTTRQCQAYRAMAQNETIARTAPNDDRVHLAQALGVESLVVTTDGYAVLFRRSEHVADMPGWYCCPGGHPEPNKIVNESSLLAGQHFDDDEDRLEPLAHWFAHCTSSCIVRELFDAAVEEVVAELGLPEDQLSNQGVLALMFNKATCKPDLLFVVTCTMTASSLLAHVRATTAIEAYERAEDSVCFVDLWKGTSNDRGGAGCSDSSQQGGRNDLPLLDASATEVPITPPSMACLVLGREWVLSKRQ